MKPVGRYLEAIRKLAVERGITPEVSQALYLRWIPREDCYCLDIGEIAGEGRKSLEKFIAWFNDNHQDMLPPGRCFEL